MTIQAISPINDHRLAPPARADALQVELLRETQSRRIDGVERVDVTVDIAKPPDGTGDEQPARETERAHGRANGVLRLLEAGHFRGVADVRLRTNFFDELSARQQEQAGPVLRKQSDRLRATVNGAVGELSISLADSEESRDALGALVTEFELTVASTTDLAISNTSVDAKDLETSLRSAFDALIEGIADVLAPAVREPNAPVTTEGNPRVGGEGITRLESESIEGSDLSHEIAPLDVTAVEAPAVEPNDALDNALVSLRDTFETALSELLQAFSQAQELGDLQRPKGNGVAFDRFLSVYQSLTGASPTVDEHT